ncbi:hypothetical protein [Paracoccus sp. SJTW-4]|uniref:hypothetical protein n=1 Tax=Paracoccus sp. SJTW-4 TaxID=3078428 RepID=UPI0039E95B09
MSDLAIIDARDDLHHVTNLLKAMRFIADSAAVGSDLGEAISEIVEVALSSLEVADGRLADLVRKSR